MAILGENSSSHFNKQLQILKALERKPLSATELHDSCHIPLPTVYRHLKLLFKNNLVEKTVGTYYLTDRGRQILEVLKP